MADDRPRIIQITFDRLSNSFGKIRTAVGNFTVVVELQNGEKEPREVERSYIWPHLAQVDTVQLMLRWSYRMRSSKAYLGRRSEIPVPKKEGFPRKMYDPITFDPVETAEREVLRQTMSIKSLSPAIHSSAIPMEPVRAPPADFGNVQHLLLAQTVVAPARRYLRHERADGLGLLLKGMGGWEKGTANGARGCGIRSASAKTIALGQEVRNSVLSCRKAVRACATMSVARESARRVRERICGAERKEGRPTILPVWDGHVHLGDQPANITLSTSALSTPDKVKY
ncbi:hypothetical protein FB451DRAFT_1185215 [Mycena latifolia]|nr:hypothetical protein FB451DRAFT_1185215 [Mycena latifolia]